MTVKFTNPINDPSNLLFSVAEGYFDLSESRRYRCISSEGESFVLEAEDNHHSCLGTVVKVASWATLVVPLAMLSIKAYYRSTREFTVRSEGAALEEPVVPPTPLIERIDALPVGKGSKFNRGVFFAASLDEMRVADFFYRLGKPTCTIDRRFAFLSDEDLCFGPARRPMIEFIQGKKGLVARAHRTYLCDASEGNVGGKIYSYTMRRDPFTQPQGAVFEFRVRDKKLRISAQALAALQQQTGVYYADISSIADTASRSLWGFGREFLGYERGRDDEELVATLHGKSQRGRQAFRAKHLITASCDHTIWARDAWAPLSGVDESVLDDQSPQTIFSRPAVNHAYGMHKGKPKHDVQDHLFFNGLESAEDVRHFTNYLCYLYWLDFCVAEARGIECPTLSTLGCGAFAPPAKREVIREATATAYRFCFEHFPFRSVKSCVITAQGDHYPTFERVFAGYDSRRALPLALLDRDMMTTHRLGQAAGVKTSITNAGDSHRIPGEYWQQDMNSVEEGLAKATTMVVTQHPDLNPRYVLNPDNYLSFDLSSVVQLLSAPPTTASSVDEFKSRFRAYLDGELLAQRSRLLQRDVRLQRKEELAAGINLKLGIAETERAIGAHAIQLIEGDKTRFEVRFEEGNPRQRHTLELLRKEFPRASFRHIAFPAGAGRGESLTFYSVITIEIPQ